jgi:polyamine oxidase
MSPLSVVIKLLAATVCIHGLVIPQAAYDHLEKSTSRILILGGGVAGIMAARTFHDHGITNFLVIEGRDELGGRLRSASFAGHTVELGANWVQGTYSSNHPSRPANPIFKLVEKHKVKTRFSNHSNNFSKLS